MRHFIIFILFIFSACSKEVCSKESFTGNWTGIEDCVVSGSRTVDINVKEDGDKLVLNGVTNLVNEPMERDDCELNGGKSLGGLGTVIQASLAENTLTITLKSGINSSALICTYTLTKK